MHIWRQWLCNYIEPSVFNCQAAHYYAFLCPVFVENSDVVGGFLYMNLLVSYGTTAADQAD